MPEGDEKTCSNVGATVLRAYDIHGLDGRLGHGQLQQDGWQGTTVVFEAGPGG